jgi:hypothetical protein
LSSEGIRLLLLCSRNFSFGCWLAGTTESRISLWGGSIKAQHGCEERLAVQVLAEYCPLCFCSGYQLFP